ncbi:hypothetical protein OfM1_08490 [Lactovum odontotermitis]
MANKKKKIIVIAVVLLAILAGIIALVLLTSGNGAKKTTVSSTSKMVSSSSSSVFSSSSSSSSSEQPATNGSYTAAMGDRLSSQPLPVIGQIAIPDLGINLPVFEGAGDTQILYGAGTVSDNSTIGTGNIALASHHVFYIAGADSYLFSPLTGAQTGMMIYMTDETYVYKYKIDSLFVVPDTDLSVLDPVAGKTVVTLIYCVNFTGPDRAIVRGTLESKTAYADSDPAVQAYFAGPYNQVSASQVGGLE